MRRKICFPMTSRAYYGRSQLLIRKLHDHPAIELELMLGGSILLDKYSRHIAEDIAAGGFTISASLFNVIEGGNHVAMAKTACLTALEFTNGFHSIDPDIVVVCGDRFEQLAIAMAAAYLNKTIAHIEGGEVSEGAIDDAVRNALTKMSHVHFTATESARRRVLAMGEEEWRVHRVGAPSLDHLERTILMTPAELAARLDLVLRPPTLVVAYHPVTLARDTLLETDAVFGALTRLPQQILFCFPNADAGSRALIARAQAFCQEHPRARLFVLPRGRGLPGCDAIRA
jgi:UDP-N-acetylglucosamine 2-epimerase (non-hydrolysing)/GDP/UDP-N,N'-diacetylbacillosamine 2-epimerase (hydrolysing)